VILVPAPHFQGRLYGKPPKLKEPVPVSPGSASLLYDAAVEQKQMQPPVEGAVPVGLWLNCDGVTCFAWKTTKETA